MKQIMACLLAVTLSTGALSGCASPKSTSSQPPQSSANQPASSAAGTPEDRVIARVGTVEIMHSQLDKQMMTPKAMYHNLTDQLLPEQLQQKQHEAAMSALEGLISRQILDNQINVYQITLTPQEQTEAAASWDKIVAAITESVQKSDPSLTGDALEQMVQTAIEFSGMNRQTVQKDAEHTAKTEKLKEQLLRELPPPSAQEIESSYQTLLQTQKAKFNKETTAFEAAMLDQSTVVYVPAEYRVVKEIILRCDDDIIALLEQLKQYDTEDDTTYEDMQKNEQDRLEKELASIQSKFAGGMPFSELMEQYKAGSGARVNYVSKQSTRFSADYLAAAMSIEQTGMIAKTPVPQQYGYTVLYWENTLQAGEIPLESVREQIAAGLLDETRRAAWAEQLASWRAQADVEIFEQEITY